MKQSRKNIWEEPVDMSVLNSQFTILLSLNLLCKTRGHIHLCQKLWRAPMNLSTLISELYACNACFTAILYQKFYNTLTANFVLVLFMRASSQQLQVYACSHILMSKLALDKFTAQHPNPSVWMQYQHSCPYGLIEVCNLHNANGRRYLHQPLMFIVVIATSITWQIRYLIISLTINVYFWLK